MNIAFYAPLKHPGHPVPSGDREMARGLIAAVEAAGHAVVVVSTLRSFLAEPKPDAMGAVLSEASRAIEAIASRWRDIETGSRPDLWLTYHNYYKAPDLIGPDLALKFDLPYVIAEASHAPRREFEWGPWHAAATKASQDADMHVCLTTRDRAGLSPIVRKGVPIVNLPPFLYGQLVEAPDRKLTVGPVRLVAVAMMRHGDKLRSYRFLAGALALLEDIDWHLTLIGDGVARLDVTAAFATCPPERLTWRGELPRDEVGAGLRDADVFAWPGLGEAFGIAYLEAQAAGLPVVALDVAGVSSVVMHGQTGLLVPACDCTRYADALRRLIVGHGERRRMGQAAANFIRSERTVAGAAAILGEALSFLSARKAASKP